MKRLVIALVAGLATGAFALSPLGAASASPKPTTLGSATVVLGTPVSCSFPVTYTWSGFAGSNDAVRLWLDDSLDGTVTGVFEQAKVRGGSGSVSHSFDGLIRGVQYRAWGELVDDHGNALLGSLVFSAFGSC